MKLKVIHNKNGYRFWETDDPNTYQTFVHEETQRELFFYPYLRERMYVFDVGVNVGSYSLPALARGCYVYCINPPTPSLEIFKQSVRLNKGFFPTVYDVALYSKKGWLNPQTQEFSKYRKLPKIPPNYRNEDDSWYETDYLDGMYSGRIDYIKMDIEGAELEALKGAKMNISINKPIMLIECHCFKDAEIEQKVYDLIINEWKLSYMYMTRHYERGLIRTEPHPLDMLISRKEDTWNHTHCLFVPVEK